MGLDISFNKEAAVAAGLILTQTQRGTDEEVDQAITTDDREEYIEWLREKVTVITVPTANVSAEAEDFDGSLTVRANKWGRVYGPLTGWLTVNQITWREF